MAQELVWPLALAYESEAPDNAFYRQPAIKAWVEAGILYAARHAHRDGACDDYFPHERCGVGCTAGFGLSTFFGAWITACTLKFTTFKPPLSLILVLSISTCPK